MKKLIALLLALVMVIGLVACGAEEAPVEEAPVEEAPVEEAPVEEAPVEEAPVEEAKKTIYVLVPNPDHGWTGAIGVAA